VAGMQIPPVERFVTGYRNGARAFNPAIEHLNVYIPSFDDPTAGWMAGEDQLRRGADVIFGVGGNTGNGGLVAAHDAGIMAIGVDVDQYETLPDVNRSLLTSAMKNVDVAAAGAVRAFAAGELEAGITVSTLENGGIGLAPFHDMEPRVPASCKAAVERAANGLATETIETGYD
jgi:basic membrane protein A